MTRHVVSRWSNILGEKTGDILLFSSSYPLPSSMRAIMTLLHHCCRMFHVQYLRDYLHNHASTCHGGQRDLCVWVLFVFMSIITYQVFEALRYNLRFSLPSVDRSITHARDTSDTRQLTYFCAYFSISCRLSCFFSKFVNMNFPRVLP